MQRTGLFALGTLVGALTVVGVLLGPLYWLSDATTTQSLSPGDQYRIHLVEIGSHIPLNVDRNFELRLEELETGELHTIFSSPDEGRPIGSERFVWSTDSAHVLLVGRHFYGDDGIRVGCQERAYLLYHVPSQSIWLNSGEQKLTREHLERIEFAEPLFVAPDGSAGGPSADTAESDSTLEGMGGNSSN